MHDVFRKSFGGLSRAYLVRQYFFGAIPFAVFGWLAWAGGQGTLYGGVLLVDLLLYPYARFVYEQAVEFLQGDNLWLVNGFLLLVAKAITIALCFGFAPVLGPLGLAWLFLRTPRGGAGS